jgi:hypothetical protein
MAIDLATIIAGVDLGEDPPTARTLRTSRSIREWIDKTAQLAFDIRMIDGRYRLLDDLTVDDLGADRPMSRGLEQTGKLCRH